MKMHNGDIQIVDEETGKLAVYRRAKYKDGENANTIRQKRYRGTLKGKWIYLASGYYFEVENNKDN